METHARTHAHATTRKTVKILVCIKIKNDKRDGIVFAALITWPVFFFSAPPVPFKWGLKNIIFIVQSIYHEPAGGFLGMEKVP